MTPFDGDAFLTSAITAGRARARREAAPGQRPTGTLAQRRQRVGRCAAASRRAAPR
jgi:hypothetical protein